LYKGMKTSMSENETAALTKVIFSWSFLWFFIYCLSVIITVGFVSFGIAYFTDYFFQTDIISATEKMNCGIVGGMTCTAEQGIIKLFTTLVWPIVIIPVAVAIIASLKYDRIRKITNVVR